jgi:hypothetical protein
VPSWLPLRAAACRLLRANPLIFITLTAIS